VQRILSIDDDASVLDMIAMTLEDAGFDVHTAGDGAAGLALHRQRPFDALVSDVNMPGVDGFSLCRTLREAGDPVPILLLTARDTEIDEALGLDLGADDFLTKPFSSRVLLARLRAVLRRGGAIPSAGAVLRDGPLALDPARLQVTLHDQPITVTVTEFRLLQALVRQPGVVLSRAVLLAEARQDESVVAPRLIDTYVRRLRRKLEAVDPSFACIETVVGAGYRWRG